MAPTMKSRVFTFISLLVLAVAMVAAPSASAQSPAQNVYNPNGEVLDVVDGGGGSVPDIKCTEADGLDPDGNSVPEGSKADCSENDDEVCAAADGRDGDGNSVAYGSEADCSGTPTTVTRGELPFTGFEAGMVGLAGMMLLGAGMAARRLSRHES